MGKSEPEEPEIPKQVIARASGAEIVPDVSRARGFLGKLRYLLFIPVLLFSGAVIGLYIQPPGLQKFFEITGLKPGGGTSAPIALPAEIEIPQDVIDTLQITDVIGLARLIPRGDISPVAAPSGAGDARIDEILVGVGETLQKGEVVAFLDNLAQLESAVKIAQANVGIREANLLQTRQSVANSLNEALAVLEQAEAVAEVAKSDRLRTDELFGRGVTTQAAQDAAISADTQADRAVEKARATLSRYDNADIEDQPDVIVAARNLDAAIAEFDRALQDLDRARVVTPISGVVLAVHARPGERPPSGGIMDIGDTSQMMAEVEIYQDRIALVKPGQPVEIVSNAVGQTLNGTVERIGLMVESQDFVSSDTAANTDARVIEVLVRLDQKSSLVAARYTNLEAVARVDTRVKK